MRRQLMESKTLHIKLGRLLCMIALVIAVIAAIMAVPAVSHADETDPGMIYWAVDSNGKLTISDTAVEGTTTGSFEADAVFDSPPWGAVKAIDVSGTPKPISMKNWFSGCFGAMYQTYGPIDFSGLDTSACEDMSYMFNNCTFLTLPLDLSGFDTSACKDMSHMFSGAMCVPSLTLDSFDTSNCENMSYMFSDCQNLSFGDSVSGFNTSKCKDMSYMFNKCTKLETVDISRFNTSACTNMDSMFSGCNNLVSIKLTGCDTSKCTNMNCMFKDCEKLEELDMSTWDMSAVTVTTDMVTHCKKLVKIKLGSTYKGDAYFPYNPYSSWVQSDLQEKGAWIKKETNEVFFGVTAIPNGAGTYEFSLEGPAEYNAYWALTSVGTDQYALTISPDPLSGDYSGAYNTATCPWAWESAIGYSKNKVVSVEIRKGADGSRVKYPTLTFDVINNNNILETRGLFSHYYKMVSADIRGLDMSKCSTAAYLFSNCEVLADINMDGLDMTGVKAVDSMFGLCRIVIVIDLSNVIMPDAASAQGMFSDCYALKTIKFNENKKPCFTNMKSMFSNCRELESVNLSALNTSKCTNMATMFYWCFKLESVDLRGFDTSGVNGTENLFNGCRLLKSLDLSGFDLSSNWYAENMFQGCAALEKLVIGPKWKNNYSVSSGNTKFNATMYRADDGSYTEYSSGTVIPGYQASKAGVNIYVNAATKDDPQARADIAAAVALAGKINALSQIKDPAARKEAAEALQAAYNALTDNQKQYVPNSVLNSLEAAGNADVPQSSPVSPGASAEAADAAITSMTTDTDPKGSVFSKLAFKSKKQAKSSVKLSWNKAGNAKTYVIYGNKCGKGIKPVKIATSTGNALTVKTISGKKLAKGTYYKFIIVALDGNNKVVSTSKLIHVATSGGKVGNHKKVTVKKAVTKKAKKLKKGKSLKLKAKAVKKSKKVKKHVGVRYESTNTQIATVSAKGVVKANNKGTCYVYAYAQNGVFKKVKVTVK